MRRGGYTMELTIVLPLFAVFAGGLVDVGAGLWMRRDFARAMTEICLEAPADLDDATWLLEQARARLPAASFHVTRDEGGLMRLDGALPFDPPVGLLGRRLLLRHTVYVRVEG